MGKIEVEICMGTTCFIMGGESLQELLGNEIAVYEWKGDFETAKLKMESYLERYPEDEKAQREYLFLQTR